MTDRERTVEELRAEAVAAAKAEARASEHGGGYATRLINGSIFAAFVNNDGTLVTADLTLDTAARWVRCLQAALVDAKRLLGHGGSN